MEELIDEGRFAAVIDFTTSEIAEELVGGSTSAAPGRLPRIGRLGLPQSSSRAASTSPSSAGARKCRRG